MSAAAIHGDKSQGQRDRALGAFRKAKVNILVATDIAARGIDIDDVSHVFNFDLPNVPEAYVHRIGRTARAGKSGIAVSLCDPAERGLLKDIEKLIDRDLGRRRKRLIQAACRQVAAPRQTGQQPERAPAKQVAGSESK